MKRGDNAKAFRVLVVDDDPEIDMLFRRVMGKGFQSVTIARDAYEAVERISSQKYELILLDANLPGVNGSGTLEKIKSILSDSIVAMVSGYSVEEEVNKAIDVGTQALAGNTLEDTDQIMTIEEVARYLSLHELTVRRLAREGEIPAFKIGRQWRVKKALLDRWIEREVMRNIGEGSSHGSG